MSAVKTRLTKDEEKELKYLLGSSHLTLLYKGSVHGFTAAEFHAKCDNQGPTVTVAYNGSGFIFGGFTSQSYVSAQMCLTDKNAFLFRLRRKEGVVTSQTFVCQFAANAVYVSQNNGPNFGNCFQITLGGNSASSVTINANQNYIATAEELTGNDLMLLECEVYRVEDYNDFLESPWRKVTWTAGERNKIMEEIRSYKPYLNPVSQVRILFVGPIGVGKSSFFNSVNSVFRGYVTGQAITGSDNTSVTTQYRMYPVKDGRDGKTLPVIFCDTMGLEEKLGFGLEIDEITNLIKGHIPDRYQFNSAVSICPDSLGYIKSPALKDQIHCVVFVIDGCKIEILSEALEQKLKQLRRKVNQLGVPQMVCMTKVDELCPALEDHLAYVYQSKAVVEQMSIHVQKRCSVMLHNYRDPADCSFSCICVPTLQNVSKGTSTKEEEVNEAFFKHMTNISKTSEMVLMGDFNFLDICWKNSAAKCKMSSQFLTCVEDNYLFQKVEDVTRGSSIFWILS
ncbi:interferon-induced protein 44-like isoform X2 [Alligator mississippiensis]|uniref:interferon-induced protein 44-like isoform X2 n=1 Tax=Alligator mississippiensis TaxID=8496 RepID=UPI0009074CAE|nr:interferon-induced protein 44-like isoform X2 [Alligator mississippiensis]